MNPSQAFIPSKQPTFQPNPHAYAAPQYNGNQGYMGDFAGNGQSLPMPAVQVDANGKYKTELCKNWIETAKCRYQDKCRFAHGQEELTVAAIYSYNEKFKSKNCRTFYQTKQCMYGTRCMFRHEHRSFKQLHRHFYTPHLYVLETLYAASTDKAGFLQSYKPQTKRLPIFA